MVNSKKPTAVPPVLHRRNKLATKVWEQIQLTIFKLFNVLIFFSYKLMGTLNLLSEFLDGQPLFVKSHKDLIFFAIFILLLLGFAK